MATPPTPPTTPPAMAPVLFEEADSGSLVLVGLEDGMVELVEVDKIVEEKCVELGVGVAIFNQIIRKHAGIWEKSRQNVT